MSNHTNKELYIRNIPLNRHVGGNMNEKTNDKLNIDNQNKVLREQNKLIHPNYRQFNNVMYDVANNTNINNNIDIDRPNASSNLSKTINPNVSNQNYGQLNNPYQRDVYMRGDTNRYDPYQGYLYQRGLLDDGNQKRRYHSHYVDINSIFRIREPSVIIEESILLDSNPLVLRNESNRVFIKHPDHTFEVNDPITLTGVEGKLSILRTFLDSGEPSFIIPQGCNFMKIFYNHGVPTSYTGSNIFIELQNIKGDRGTADTSSY